MKDTDFPFTLRGQGLVSNRTYKEFFSSWDVVVDHGEEKIVREPAFIYALADAIIPTIEERENSIDLFGELSRKLRSDTNEELKKMARIALGNLAKRARSGDGKALWIYAEIVREAAEGLSQMEFTNRKALRPLARLHARWPLMKSTHPKNCDPDKWLVEMELGENAGMQIDKHSKWKPDFAAEIAISLVEHLNFMRLENPIVLIPGGQKKRMAEWLPPFSKDTVEMWWKVARYDLLRSYPDPTKILEFERIIPKANAKRRSAGRFKQAILDKIESRFMALAK